jgi:hypothetical protein
VIWSLVFLTKAVLPVMLTSTSVESPTEFRGHKKKNVSVFLLRPLRKTLYEIYGYLVIHRATNILAAALDLKFEKGTSCFDHRPMICEHEQLSFEVDSTSRTSNNGQQPIMASTGGEVVGVDSWRAQHYYYKAVVIKKVQFHCCYPFHSIPFSAYCNF